MFVCVFFRLCCTDASCTIHLYQYRWPHNNPHTPFPTGLPPPAAALRRGVLSAVGLGGRDGGALPGGRVTDGCVCRYIFIYIYILYYVLYMQRVSTLFLACLGEGMAAHFQVWTGGERD